MDYKIKFEYKGMGKQAAGIRNKILQSRKAPGERPGGPAPGQTIASIKSLNTSIQKLIASNKELSRAISGGSTGGGGFPRGGGGGMPGGGGAGRSILRGSGIASLGYAGFAIQKINQIGNAYIEKTSQQIKNMGMAGFRYGKGVYGAAEMGAGMGEYARARGQFAVGVRPDQTALDIGAIYGLSAPETMRTAGQFRRAGGNLRQAARVGAGMGIETELPMLLTGMAGIMTDAVREGVNTSKMSDDMAKNIARITMATPGKSVEAAMGIIKNFQSVKKQIAGGKMGTAEALYATKASQQMLMEALTGAGKEEYIQRLTERGVVSQRQAKGIRGLTGEADFEQLMRVAPGAAFPLLRKFTAESDPSRLMMRTMENIKKQFGEGPEGFQRFSDFATSTGWTQSQPQIEALWQTGEMPDVGAVEKKGAGIIARKTREVEKSSSAFAIRQARGRENLVFKYGASFAKSSLKMEEQLIRIAEKAAPTAIQGIELVGKAAETLAKDLNDLSTRTKGFFQKIKKGDITGAAKIYQNIE